MTQNDDPEFGKIRAALRAASESAPPSSTTGDGTDLSSVAGDAKSEVGGMQRGEVVVLPPRSASGGLETNDLAGKNLNDAFIGGSHPGVGGASVRGSCPTTKQLRLRLPHDFAAALKKHPSLMRGTVFMCAVLGELGSTHAPAEFVAAVEHLQRIRMLLRLSLEWELPEGLPARVQNTIQMIDRMCRARRVGYVSVRLRLPGDYADALLTLSPAKRERIIRLAVCAGATPISLQMVVSQASMLRDRGKRLNDRLQLRLAASPAVEIRQVLDVIWGPTQGKGGQP